LLVGGIPPDSAKLFAVFSSLDSGPNGSPEIFGGLRSIAIRVRLSVRELFANGFLLTTAERTPIRLLFLFHFSPVP
jgi:hypothetical protein